MVDTSIKDLEDHKCQTKGEKNRKASNLRSLRKCYYQASLPGIKTPISKLYEQFWTSAPDSSRFCFLISSGSVFSEGREGGI